MTTDHDKIAALLQQQRTLIGTYGRAIAYVFDADGIMTPFGYTIGLTEHGDGHPELVIAGLDPIVTSALLNDLAGRVLTRGERFTHGQTITDLLRGHSAVIVTGPIPDTLHPGALDGHYGPGRFTLQQIVWPDPAGRFPWQDGYGYPDTVQPNLGRP